MLSDEVDDDRALVGAVGVKVRHRHGCDPIDVLGKPAAAVYFCDGDPIRTIMMTANDRDVDEQGNLQQLRDVDCTAGVTGALGGALHEIGAIASGSVADALEPSKKIYGIHVESNARRFCEAVYDVADRPPPPR